MDTHIFIWWADQTERPSPTALSALEDEANELILSVASVWEMQIKTQLGKLSLRLPLTELLKNQQETNALTVLAVTLAHVLLVDALPFHHKDPFDRLLIAQSIEEDLTIVTTDSQFQLTRLSCCIDGHHFVRPGFRHCTHYTWIIEFKYALQMNPTALKAYPWDWRMDEGAKASAWRFSSTKNKQNQP